MNKHRINTTISKKHWDLLKKYADTYETQQKVLEKALEILDTRQNQRPSLSPEQELVVRFLDGKAGCLIQKDGLKMLLENLNPEITRKYIAWYKPMEYALEYYYQKPLKECQLEEVIEGIVINARMSHWFDTVNYADDGDYYSLKITHSLGVSVTDLLRVSIESALASYGVPSESTISGKIFFMKIFKKDLYRAEAVCTESIGITPSWPVPCR
jgi:hypothetical protein